MKAEKIYGFLGILVIILLAFVILWNANIIGVAAGSLEKDAREEQQIDSDWLMTQAVGEDMCAMLFYDEETGENVYSIYAKRDGASYGYFFSQGGADAYISEGVRGMIFDDKVLVLLSMNVDKVSSIVVGDDTENVIEVDPSKPFAAILPINNANITLYNTAGEPVSLYDVYR